MVEMKQNLQAKQKNKKNVRRPAKATERYAGKQSLIRFTFWLFRHHTIIWVCRCRYIFLQQVLSELTVVITD